MQLASVPKLLTCSADGKFEEAMTLADKLVRWEPRNGTHRIHQGFIAYLTGDKNKALEAFQKARELVCGNDDTPRSEPSSAPPHSLEESP